MNKTSAKGFTLIEVVASTTILVMALALALSGYIFLLKNTNQSDIQYELDLDVQMAIEHLKKDLRLSSMDEIFYYPEGTPPYTAISFPIAHINPSTGRLNRDPVSKEIIWDETILYHIRPATPDELVRTTITPRNDALSDHARQTQLNSVVAAGNGDGVAGDGTASSKIIFANLLDWELNPRIGLFSGYDPQNGKLEEVSMGYVLLDPGPHIFTFRVTGKDPRSSGYDIGIDKLMASPSYRYREAEDQERTGNSGITPVNKYNPSYIGKHYLHFPASRSGDYFSIKLANDCWEETNFGGQFSATEKTKIMTDYDLAPVDVVVKLEGNDLTWEAETQTGDYSGGYTPTNNLEYTVIRTLIKGANIENNGNFLDCNGARCKLTFAASDQSLKIDHVYIGESASSNTTAMIIKSGALLGKFSNNTAVEIPAKGTATTDWIDLPISTDKNYIITYAIIGGSGNDAPKIWRDLRAINQGTAPTTQIAHISSGEDHDQLDAVLLPNWNMLSSSIPGATYAPSFNLHGLANITASYVERGTYTSDIFDTMLNGIPIFTDMSWDTEGESSIEFKVRTGPNLFDLLSIPWTNKTSHAFSFAPPLNRYIQFQALMESDSATRTETPILKDVTIKWTGERRMVNIQGLFAKGPNCGNFELLVDGKPLQSALIVDLEIYKKSQAMNQQSRKVTSSIKAEITPRNSGL